MPIAAIIERGWIQGSKRCVITVIIGYVGTPVLGPFYVQLDRCFAYKEAAMLSLGAALPTGAASLLPLA